MGGGSLMYFSMSCPAPFSLPRPPCTRKLALKLKRPEVSSASRTKRGAFNGTKEIKANSTNKSFLSVLLINNKKCQHLKKHFVTLELYEFFFGRSHNSSVSIGSLNEHLNSVEAALADDRFNQSQGELGKEAYLAVVEGKRGVPSGGGGRGVPSGG